MNDAALLDSLHAALRNPDLAWYAEFHAGESIVAGYLDSLTDDCLFANSIWPEPELLGLVDDLTGRTGRNL